jgi:protein-arginine kinase activator protein McsA
MTRKTNDQYLKMYPTQICKPCQTFYKKLTYGILRCDLQMNVCAECYKTYKRGVLWGGR